MRAILFSLLVIGCVKPASSDLHTGSGRGGKLGSQDTKPLNLCVVNFQLAGEVPDGCGKNGCNILHWKSDNPRVSQYYWVVDRLTLKTVKEYEIPPFVANPDAGGGGNPGDKAPGGKNPAESDGVGTDSSGTDQGSDNGGQENGDQGETETDSGSGDEKDNNSTDSENSNDTGDTGSSESGSDGDSSSGDNSDQESGDSEDDFFDDFFGGESGPGENDNCANDYKCAEEPFKPKKEHFDPKDLPCTVAECSQDTYVTGKSGNKYKMTILPLTKSGGIDCSDPRVTCVEKKGTSGSTPFDKYNNACYGTTDLGKHDSSAKGGFFERFLACFTTGKCAPKKDPKNPAAGGSGPGVPFPGSSPSSPTMPGAASS